MEITGYIALLCYPRLSDFHVHFYGNVTLATDTTITTNTTTTQYLSCDFSTCFLPVLTYLCE